MQPDFILNNSDLLIKENCIIFEGVLYERLRDPKLDEFFGSNCDIFRFFLDVDHYDYVEDNTLISNLHLLFQK